MNWFERYAIPGIYSVLLFAILYGMFREISLKGDAAVAIFGAALSVSIPLGYILVVLSQRLYYWIHRWQVFSPAWSEAGKGEERGAEWRVEAEAAILARVRANKDGVEWGRWIQDWSMKRFDVLAINRSLWLATALGILLDMLGFFALGVVHGRWVFWDALLFFVVCVVILLILTSNSRVLKKQLIRFHTAYYERLRTGSSRVANGSLWRGRSRYCHPRPRRLFYGNA